MTKPTHDRQIPAAETPNHRAGLRRDELLPGETNPASGANDYDMSGAPGGGLASGGMGGTNRGRGDIDNADIEGALGGSPADTNGDNQDTSEPQAGRAGGAVGGTPAGKRSSGD